MLTWRRTFATSVARLNNRPAARSAGSTLLRCAQVLEQGQKGSSLEDQEIQLNGFIRSVRKQKRFAFAEISDGSTVKPLQAILNPSQAAEYVLCDLETFSPPTLDTDCHSHALQTINRNSCRNLRSLEGMSARQGADT